VTVAMLQNFAAVGLRSIVIETAMENSDPAVIRIGNTGAAASLPPFLASCPQPGAVTAEHAELKTDAK
jgi:hypothetical protein